jgi:hypothetical protein
MKEISDMAHINGCSTGSCIRHINARLLLCIEFGHGWVSISHYSKDVPCQ